MRKVFIFVLAFSLAVLATSAFAQSSTTGTIEGQVVDVNGAPVPGVTVAAKSPNLITPQTAQSDDQGRYRILAIPPGRYTVTVAATKGFAEFTKSDVEVNLDKTSTIDVRLHPAGAQATVTVTDTSGAAVDVTSNTTGTNVSSDQFSSFPTQRTVQSLYTITPTATRSGLRDSSGRERDPSVGGSSGPENNYILDGINVTDPGFGGSGANLPFEFVQEVEIKTGAFGAEYGKATGGIFNVITKSGGNEVHGDAFGYFTTKGLVRETKSFSFLGVSPNGFSEIDAGFDIGGPIKKDKLWFFGAFNPQRRENFFLAQTTSRPLSSKVTTPFYAGKLTFALNQNNTLTASTFGDFTKLEGFVFRGLPPLRDVNGFGANPNSFLGTYKSGGSNYAARLNSTIRPNWIGEFSWGLHLQRNSTHPSDATQASQFWVQDTFAIIKPDGSVANAVEPGALQRGAFVAYVYGGSGSTLGRNYTRQGFATGQISDQNRNRWEASARFQNIWGRHTFKYGFEYNNNKYKIDTIAPGPTQTFPNTLGLPGLTGTNNVVNGARVENRWAVCTVRGATIVCPNDQYISRIEPAVTAGQVVVNGVTITSVIGGPITAAEANTNPFLVLLVTRVRDFQLHTAPVTKVESFYISDEYKMTPNLQVTFGIREDYQQAGSNAGGTYFNLNHTWQNLQPRIGLTWDFTGKGNSKLFVNYARYLETPIPLDVAVRSSGGNAQTDKNFNSSHVNAPPGSYLAPAIGGVAASNLGADPTPVDSDIRPPTVNELTAGIEYEIVSNLTLTGRGIYRAQGSVIEDGSFDDGDHYFLFNPGESHTEKLACAQPTGCFGRARRYYRAFEFTATKRFTHNYQFIASYVFSSLTGNYEGLFRNDNGQSDPNITSLFDLPGLLANTYGRLPNDRPHQFKFDGSYQLPFRLMISGSFHAQSGIPFNRLGPHEVYGDNEAFLLPRGTAGRTPVTYNLDLGAYYPIRFGEKRQLRLQADWFNVFNSQRAVNVDETFLIRSGLGGPESGVQNPHYGTGTVFQFPSALRLGVKFQF